MTQQPNTVDVLQFNHAMADLRAGLARRSQQHLELEMRLAKLETELTNLLERVENIETYISGVEATRSVDIAEMIKFQARIAELETELDDWKRRKTNTVLSATCPTAGDKVVEF